jgi:hypothetical protein
VFLNELKKQADRCFARSLYDLNVDIGNVLSNVQWLMAPAPRRPRSRAIRIGQRLSLSNALAAACAVFYLSGRFDDAALHAAMLDEQATVRYADVSLDGAVLPGRALACAEVIHTALTDSQAAELNGYQAQKVGPFRVKGGAA